MRRVVVDASVLVAGIVVQEPFAADARRVIDQLERGEVAVLLPMTASIELTSAIVRRLGTPADALRLEEGLRAALDAELIDIDRELAERARLIAAELELRSGDAIYVAVTRAHDASLISLDRELIERAGAIAPAAWLEAQTSG